MKIKYIKVPEIYIADNETWEDISNKFGFSVQALKNHNQIKDIKKRSIIALPVFGEADVQSFKENEKEKYYIVKPADTLEKIANKVGVSVFVLKQKNNIENVFIGQRLVY